MKRRGSILPTAGLCLTLSAALISCGGDADTAQAPVETATGGQDETTSSPEPAVDPRAVVVDLREVPWAVPLEVNLDDMILQRSGLYVQVLAEGRGPRATPGDEMNVHYRVWLPNGRLIDGSYEHDPPDPLNMVLGVTQLIDGWSQGVSGMRVGERRRLVLPHELAYGPAGHPAGIPPYSPLLYVVELMSLTPGDPPAPPDGN